MVAEFKANGPEFRRNVEVKLRSSYSSHYRVGMVKLLQTLTFRSNNTMHQPIIAGIDLVLKYAQSQFQSYPKDAVVPVTGVLEGAWIDLAYRGDPASSRILRTVYEVCLFRTLRERLRCKEIWVEGADRWRDPEEDLPADFEAHRGVYYAKLAKPLAAAEFIEPLRAEMTAELEALGFTVVTHKIADPNRVKSIKIPEPCNPDCCPHTNPFDVRRKAAIRLKL